MASNKSVYDNLSSLGGAFPETKVSPEMVQAYIRGLEGINDEALTRSVDYLIRTGQYFPRVSAIRTAAAKFTAQPTARRGWIVPDFEAYQPQQAPAGWKQDIEDAKELADLAVLFGNRVNVPMSDEDWNKYAVGILEVNRA